jgi:hypothetical protein
LFNFVSRPICHSDLKWNSFFDCHLNLISCHNRLQEDDAWQRLQQA